MGEFTHSERTNSWSKTRIAPTGRAYFLDRTGAEVTEGDHGVPTRLIVSQLNSYRLLVAASCPRKRASRVTHRKPSLKAPRCPLPLEDRGQVLVLLGQAARA